VEINISIKNEGTQRGEAQMIYMAMAMYCEAKPFISYLGLKRDGNITRFQVFKDDEVVLIVSGVGAMASAIATTYLLTQYKVQHADLFLNIGICGTKHQGIKKGTALLCHKIIHHDTKKTFYPDMLFRHPFKEGVLETFSRVVDIKVDSEIEGDIADMEGSGAFQAASVFLPPHHICCIKIVSDYMEGEILTPDQVSELVQHNVEVISTWIRERAAAYVPPFQILTGEEEKQLHTISHNLKLSTTMNHQFKQLATHYKIRSGNLIEVLQPYLAIECKSKNEGKIHFAKIKEQLTEF
jgi:hypothetical protein